MARDEFSVGLLFVVGKIMNEPVEIVHTPAKKPGQASTMLVSNGILFFINKLAQNQAAGVTPKEGKTLKPSTYVLHKLLP